MIISISHLKQGFILSISGLSLFFSCTKPPVTDLPTEVSTFRSHGLDVCWDQSGSNLIAYSMKETDGFYDIHLANPDNGYDTCLTCNHPTLPNKHIACPYWHPSGNWILFLAEKTTHPGSSTDALPGFGAYCDIWLISKNGQQIYKVVDIPNDYDHGVIAPRFSHSGNKIVWTDRKAQPNVLIPAQTMGYWLIKTADFGFSSLDNTPYYSNVQTFEPGGSAFYESYGFSPDDSKIIFCSSMNKPSVWDQQIYTIDGNSGSNPIQLTEKDYNEHAFYTPIGNKIVWMCNTESGTGGTDWWRMNADGTQKERLTYFNESNNTQYAGHTVWAGLGSFAPEGTRFIGGRQLDLVSQEGEIMMVKIIK